MVNLKFVCAIEATDDYRAMSTIHFRNKCYGPEVQHKDNYGLSSLKVGTTVESHLSQVRRDQEVVPK